MKQKKVLIAQENGDFLRNMLVSLRGSGFECISVPKNGGPVCAHPQSFFEVREENY